MEAETDHGTVLPKDACAVMVEADGNRVILLPDMPRDTVMSESATALLAAFLRLEAEPEFAKECIDWLASWKNKRI